MLKGIKEWPAALSPLRMKQMKNEKIKEKKGEAETKEFTDSQTNFAPDAALQNARQEGMPL